MRTLARTKKGFLFKTEPMLHKISILPINQFPVDNLNVNQLGSGYKFGLASYDAPTNDKMTLETIYNPMKRSINMMDSLFENEIVEDDMVPIIDEEEYEEMPESEFPQQLAILPLRNTVLFPGVIVPITVGRSKSILLVKEAHRRSKLIGVISQFDSSVEDPTMDDLYKIGTVVKIVKILDMPDGTTSVVLQGRARFGVVGNLQTDPYLACDIIPMTEKKPRAGDQEFEAIVTSIKELSMRIIQLSKHIPQEAAFAIKNIDSPVFLINFVASNTDIKTDSKQALLELSKIKARGLKLLEHLAYEVQKQELKDTIQTKVKTELDQQQREYLLNQEIKTIQSELGSGPVESDVKELTEKAKNKVWNDKTKETFYKELEKLQRMNPAAPDYSNQVLYLHTVVDLPWNEYTTDNFDLKRAQKILDNDHFGLEKVKERIIEHLAVLKLKGDLKSPILCLYGPPGVGKTSLGRSVAEALGRKYIRMSLGGLHDESEIRGHRKTYIGAMPGRIIQNIKKANSANPVFILDEIDKIGNDFRGDPSFALLEVLDPEQNSTFYDNFLEMDFDLSKVLFIATANNVSAISAPLRDRMEMINVSGYVLEEKIEIAKRHLIRKQWEDHGLPKNVINYPRKSIEFTVEKYTRESGVRKLSNVLAKVARNLARKVATDEELPASLTTEILTEILGPTEVNRDKYEGNEYAG
ncbi:MAG: hypothetical protein RIS47_375, partial [Bacteroidota bacterium]